MRVIYIDSLFVLNLAVNFLLTLATAKICALRVRIVRFLLAAAFGAAYAVAAVIPGLPEFISMLPVRLAAGVLLALIAFGSERRFGKHLIIFFALAACFAGASMIVGIVNFRSVLLIVSLTYAFLSLALRFAAAKRELFTGAAVDMAISLGGKTVNFKALRDTGNLLRDPSNGAILPVVNYTELAQLFEPEMQTILAGSRTAVEKFTLLSGKKPAFRLIPYRVLGSGGGLLICVKADSVTVDGEPRSSRWAAISPTAIKSYGGLI